MRQIIKAVKELNDIAEQETETSYNVKKAMTILIETLVEKTIADITWRGKMIKAEETTDEKKEGLQNAINWLFKNMKPFEGQLRAMNPDLKAFFDKRALMVIKMDQEFKGKKGKSAYR